VTVKMFSVFRHREDGENDENSIDYEKQVQRNKKEVETNVHISRRMVARRYF
jgi:hypothetical protein